MFWVDNGFGFWDTSSLAFTTTIIDDQLRILFDYFYIVGSGSGLIVEIECRRGGRKTRTRRG